MKTEPLEETKEPAQIDPLVWVTIIESNTRGGNTLKGKKARLQLAMSKAKALRDAGKATIDGV